jgi:uncharacterized protein (TIGR03435 family)
VPPQRDRQRSSIRGGPGTETPGYIYATSASLSTLIQRAYELKPYQLSCPRWLDDARYDLTARIPEGTSKNEANLMMRSLLLDRFRLKARVENRELAVFLLRATSGEPKLTPSLPGGAEPTETRATARSQRKEYPDGFPEIAPEMLRGGVVRMFLRDKAKIIIDKQPLERLADVLSVTLERPVLDRTNLQGLYTFTLRWSAPSQGDFGTSVFTAVQQQLGLKLEHSRAKLPVLIVESVNRVPVEN